MDVFTFRLTSTFEEIPKPSFLGEEADLVFVHGPPLTLDDPALLENVKETYPNASIVGCSSGGEIENGNFHQNSVVGAALNFEKTTVRRIRVDLGEGTTSEVESGIKLAKSLKADDLRVIIVFSEGLGVDCDEVVQGIRQVLGDERLPVFGGLAGDSLEFAQTMVLDNDGIHENSIVAVGLYGQSLEVKTATSSFDFPGPEYQVTQSDSNMVIEIDGRPALDVFKEALGDEAKNLPANSVNFPMLLLDDDGHPRVCRTLHGMGIEEKVLLFAGSVPKGPVRFIDMIDPHRFIADAGKVASEIASERADFAFIINCAGRRAALGPVAVEQEAAMIQRKLGHQLPSIGFYSFGEIGPCHRTGEIQLHNETVNIATLHEA